VPQQHDELVAAETRYDVGRTHVANERGGNRLEHRVAGAMAVTVVDRLKFVEVEIDQRRAGAVALDVGERALELALKAAAVEHVGERIDVNPRFEVPDASAGILELRRERIDLGGEPHDDGARRRARWLCVLGTPAGRGAERLRLRPSGWVGL